jgi:hypothetical protein
MCDKKLLELPINGNLPNALPWAIMHSTFIASSLRNRVMVMVFAQVQLQGSNFGGEKR